MKKPGDICVTLFPVMVGENKCFKGSVVWGKRCFEFVAGDRGAGYMEACVCEIDIKKFVFCSFMGILFNDRSAIDSYATPFVGNQEFLNAIIFSAVSEYLRRRPYIGLWSFKVYHFGSLFGSIELHGERLVFYY